MTAGAHSKQNATITSYIVGRCVLPSLKGTPNDFGHPNWNDVARSLSATSQEDDNLPKPGIICSSSTLSISPRDKAESPSRRCAASESRTLRGYQRRYSIRKRWTIRTWQQKEVKRDILADQYKCVARRHIFTLVLEAPNNIVLCVVSCDGFYFFATAVVYPRLCDKCMR